MSGDGDAQAIPPNKTIYINNLNEKIKIDGILSSFFVSLFFFFF